jgi:hypothetical protein
MFNRKSLGALASRSFRLPLARVVALLLMIPALPACADDPFAVEESRTLAVVLADGQPLPAVHMCPAPLGEGSEAWLAFGSGTLMLDPNGDYTWRFNVGNGFSYHGSNGVRQGHGWVRDTWGTYRVGADGTLTLSEGRSIDGRVPGVSGRLTADGAELQSVPLSCPHAPPGTPSHTFSLVLR